ncbi:MAG TPA: hypothetical protein VLC79_10065 [Cellvibrio sp.]|nr:hypothetical protein [Cellvibrio sp.]
MLYSKTFRIRPQLPLLLLALLPCVCPSGFAQSPLQLTQSQLKSDDLISGDLGVPASDTNNSLIDPDSIKSTPAAPALSPAEAAELVRNKFGGQVMSVNTQHNEKGVIYGVKVLNAGRMRIINVDGQTGQLLNN